MTSIIETAPRDRNGSNGWKTAALGALWGVLLLVVGWVATAATTANADLTKAVNASQERIATLEEAQRNMRESLRRIEDGVNELRRGQDRRR